MTSIIITSYIIFLVFLFIVVLHKTCEPFHIFIMTKLFGYKKILMYDGQYEFSVPFYTCTMNVPGVPHAYRYPSSKIGSILFRADGTAHYCGSYKWKYV